MHGELIYMSSADDLVRESKLFDIDPALDDGETQIRFLYLLPNAKQWLDANLENCKTDGFFEGAVSPDEQADNFFHDFSSNQDPIFDMDPHLMRPDSDAIWEMRTADLRFFGWFWRKTKFIIAHVNTKEECIKHDLYHGYLNESLRIRNSLELDPPPFVTGLLNDLL